MTESRIPVVVLRSNDVCFLGILRGFAAAGVPTIAISFTWEGAPTWFSSYSNALGRTFEIANPFSHADQAADQLGTILKELYGEFGVPLMTIPSSDTNLMFLLDIYDRIQPYIKIMGGVDFATPRHDIMHKYHCAQLLQQHCPELVPRTRFCQSPADVSDIANDMVYPVVYKPATKDYGQSFYRAHSGNKAIQCDTPESLKLLLLEEMDAGFELVVQEKLEFDSVYDEIPFYLYANEDHEIVMAGNGVKEVIHPFPFGTALVLRFDWIDELLPLARKVVSALRYRGILMIEFLRNKNDGTWKVVEVNPRHWLFNGFYQRIGLNYSGALSRDLTSVLEPDLVTLSKPSMEDAPTHVDLAALAQLWKSEDRKLSFDQFLSKIDAIPGVLSDPFLDPADSKPGEMKINEMLSLYQWPNTGLDAIVRFLDE